MIKNYLIDFFNLFFKFCVKFFIKKFILKNFNLITILMDHYLKQNQLNSQAFKMKVEKQLKENRVQDSLRSLMRLKFIENLGKKKKDNLFQMSSKKDWTLSDKVLLSMVYNCLQNYGLKMSEAVFIPEVGEDTALLKETEIIEILTRRKNGFSTFLEKMEKENQTKNSSKKSNKIFSLII